MKRFCCKVPAQIHHYIIKTNRNKTQRTKLEKYVNSTKSKKDTVKTDSTSVFYGHLLLSMEVKMCLLILHNLIYKVHLIVFDLSIVKKK